MVDDRYMLEKRPDPPGGMKLAFDQRVIPRLIDAAAILETGFERLSLGAKRAPLSGLLIAFGLGWLLTSLTGARRRA